MSFFKQNLKKDLEEKITLFSSGRRFNPSCTQKNIVEFEKDLPVIGYFGATNKKKGIIELLEAVKKYELDRKINWIIQVDLEELKKSPHKLLKH